MGTHIHLTHEHPAGDVWRRWIAEFVIIVLALAALYLAIQGWKSEGFTPALIALGTLGGPAVVYGFGFLWCLRDLLDDTNGCHGGALLRERWSDFSLLSGSIAILVIIGAYTRAILENYSYVILAIAIGLTLAMCWLLTGCIVASEQYLSWTMTGRSTGAQSGWRGHLRTITRKAGALLLKLVGIKRAVGIGGAFVLVSLFIIVRGDIFDFGETGYAILVGKADWPESQVTNGIPFIPFLAQVHRGVYALGLLLAVVALIGIFVANHLRAARVLRVLASIAGIIAVLQVSNLAFTNIGLVSIGSKLMLMLSALSWIFPVGLWLFFVDNGPKTDKTRLSVFLFCLPLFFNAFAFLVFMSYFALGFGSFVVGILLIWWGLVRTCHEIKIRQNSHPL